MRSFTKLLETIELNDIIYHGTSKPSWNKVYKDKSLLYLVNDREEAANYAYEEAGRDELNELTPQPILLSVKLSMLLKLARKKIIRLEPDWGAVNNYDENDSYLKSLEEVGSFSIRGYIDKIKSFFEEESLLE